MEKDVSAKLIKAMRGWDAFRVENLLYPGTPDINFIGGWMETKHVKNYPAKETDLITHPDFTISQRAFLKRRALMGGKTFLFVQVQKDYYLFDGITGANYFGFLEKKYLLKRAKAFWQGRFPKSEELMAAILKDDSKEEEHGN